MFFLSETVEDFLSSEPPIFLELRVRYLQACERIQEAMTLAKSCLENHEAAQHLYFHQAYLTCLYKASLYENLHKEVKNVIANLFGKRMKMLWTFLILLFGCKCKSG